jgi:hypothetical protein
LGYFPPGRVKKGKYDAGFRCHVPSPDRVEAKGCRSSVCLAQEALDTLSIASSGGPEVFQSLLGDDQLLHLALRQLLLLGRQSGLLIPQPDLPGIRIELACQDLGTGILQSFLLPLEVGLTTVEAGLAGAHGLGLTPEGDVVQLFPLLQQPLQLFHLLRPLVDLACMHSKVLLLLDDSTDSGLGRCVQLLRISKGPLGVGVTLGNGLNLQVETMLSGSCHRPLRHCCPLEHACPQLEAPMLVSKILTFTV